MLNPVCSAYRVIISMNPDFLPLYKIFFKTPISSYAQREKSCRVINRLWIDEITAIIIAA